MSRLARAAKVYADRFSWLVFPLRGKVPSIPRSEGGHGYLDATTDFDQIDQWWRRWPLANIGLAAGVSGLVVVDIDPRNGGDASWADLAREHEIPITVACATGGGGRHLYFAGQAQSCVLAPGIEIKADGGYVVAPPSVHPDTRRRYVWDATSRPDEVAVAPVPVWLSERIDRRKSKPRRHEHTAPVEAISFALGAAFRVAGMLGTEVRPGVFLALCPNRANHTTGRDFDGSSVLFAPPPGKTRGWFHCSHAHCRGVIR